MKFLEVNPSLKKHFGNEGTFIDPRDGNVYKTVEINGQIWMAENLRFVGVLHYAPDGDENKIAEYGCLYKWEDAMLACPTGWHLPSREEFARLLKLAGSTETEKTNNLVSLNWFGDDILGFNALPSGCVHKIDRWNYEYLSFREVALFFSMEDDGLRGPYGLILSYNKASINTVGDLACSVRCIKD